MMSKRRSGYRIVAPTGRLSVLLASLALLVACQTGKSMREPEAAKAPSAAEQVGVEVVSFRQAAGGYMLDFRYRVLDGEKAAPFNDRKIKPYIIHEATGAKFLIPSSSKVGPLRQTVRNRPLPEGRVYFMIFANPGGYVKAGDLVTVVVGEHRLEHIVVE